MVDGAAEVGLGASPAEKGDGESVPALLPVEPRHILVGDRSPTRIVHLALGVKSWIAAPPSVEEARPGRCPSCGAAGRPLGGPIGLHGHGRRDRQQRGPSTADGAPEVAVVALRRFRCVGCGAVITVVPLEVEPRRHFSRPAIALALGLWSLSSLPPREVRRRISPWLITGATAAAEGWVSLRRWARAAAAGRLFRAMARAFEGSLRHVAGRVAQTAQAHAPPSVRQQLIGAQVFDGAVQMTR